MIINLKKYLSSSIGRFRVLAFLEGTSLLLLMGIAMPLKYIWDNPSWVEVIGLIHGVLFILFVVLALIIAYQYKWKPITSLIVLVSSFIPFGTFYVDHKILKEMDT